MIVSRSTIIFTYYNNNNINNNNIIAGVDFIPFAIETSGVWGVQALELVSEIGRRLTSRRMNQVLQPSFANGSW